MTDCYTQCLIKGIQIIQELNSEQRTITHGEFLVECGLAAKRNDHRVRRMAILNDIAKLDIAFHGKETLDFSVFVNTKGEQGAFNIGNEVKIISPYSKFHEELGIITGYHESGYMIKLHNDEMFFNRREVKLAQR